MKFRCAFATVLSLLMVGHVQSETLGQPLRFTVSRTAEGPSDKQLGDIWCEFKNVSEKNVRLLKTPADGNSQRFWFGMMVVGTNGTPVLDTPMGGKISMRGRKEYILIKPQEAYHCQLDYSRLIPGLPQGEYSVKVIYRNQYGVDCFHGMLESNSIGVEIR